MKPIPTNGLTPVLALFAGGVRGEGTTPELNLPRDAPGANLQLHLERQDFKIYRVEIVDPEGGLTFRSNNLIFFKQLSSYFINFRLQNVQESI